MAHRQCTRWILALLLLISPGCSSTSLFRDPGKLIGRPKFQSQVSRILCLWEPAQGTGVDGKPARGFAGQVLFFGPGSDAAVRVFGEVRISEFDNFDADADEVEPLHVFTFSADAWDVHRTEGTLGHSYSVFVPYMQKHKDPVQCALRVEFVNADGRVVASDTTDVMLPGKKNMRAAAPMQRSISRETQRRPSAASVRSPANQEPPAVSDQLETTTIRLPSVH